MLLATHDDEYLEATVLYIDVVLQEEKEGGEDDLHHLRDPVATTQVFFHELEVLQYL